jgi:hypothetical protein
LINKNKNEAKGGKPSTCHIHQNQGPTQQSKSKPDKTRQGRISQKTPKKESRFNLQSIRGIKLFARIPTISIFIRRGPVPIRDVRSWERGMEESHCQRYKRVNEGEKKEERGKEAKEKHRAPDKRKSPVIWADGWRRGKRSDEIKEEDKTRQEVYTN